jgi:hypothetical protein
MKAARLSALACVAACLFSMLPGSAQATQFPIRLFLSQDGIALSKFPSRHVLAKTIRVGRTKGKALAGWTASSDQPWLTVTPSGTTGGNLTVKADTRGLEKDQTYLANVTVSTSDADFTDSEVLRVGLYIGKNDPQDLLVQQNATSIAVNPVSPIAYVADSGSSIFEYNIYTGAAVGEFQLVAPTVGYMEASSDGSTLFAVDTTNYKIIALDAMTGAVLDKYKLGYETFNMVYARPYGQPALYIAGFSDNNGSVVAYPSGEQLATGIAPDYLAVTPDGLRVFSVSTSVSPGTIFGYSVKLKNDALSLASLGSVRLNGSNCQDLAISHDGKHVYPACGAPYEFDVYDGKKLTQVQTLPANPYPDNVEIDTNDHLVGGIDDAFQQYDVYVYDQKGFSLGHIPDGFGYYEMIDGSLKVSGDATRAVSAEYGSSGNVVLFRNMP